MISSASRSLHSQEYISIVTGTDRRLGVLGDAERLEG
jgi:hypothetical protein